MGAARLPRTSITIIPKPQTKELNEISFEPTLHPNTQDPPPPPTHPDHHTTTSPPAPHIQARHSPARCISYHDFMTYDKKLPLFHRGP